MLTASDLLPAQLHAERLHDLVALYLAESLEHGDLGALGPLRLLAARVDALIDEHAGAAHYGDGVPWRVIAEGLGVTPQALSAPDRARRRARRRCMTP